MGRMHRRSLAAILSKHMGVLVEGGKIIADSPCIGAFTVYSPHAEAVDEVLQVLVGKILHHGGERVWIRWAYRQHKTGRRWARRRDKKTGLWLAVEIIDDGRDLGPDVFDGLASLRSRLRKIGGDITVWKTTEGTLFRLELRLFR